MTDFAAHLAAWKARPPKPAKPPVNNFGRQPKMTPEAFAEWTERTGKARRARSATRVLLGIGGFRRRDKHARRQVILLGWPCASAACSDQSNTSDGNVNAEAPPSTECRSAWIRVYHI